MEKIVTLRENEKLRGSAVWMITLLTIFNFLSWLPPTLYTYNDKWVLVVNLLFLGVSLPFIVDFKKEEMALYISIAVMFILQIFSVIVTNSGYGNFAVFVVFSATIVGFKDSSFSENQLKMILISMLVPLVYWFVYSFGVLEDTVLNVGYLNPNQVAMIGVFLSLGFFVFFIGYKSRVRYISYIFILIGILTMVNSSARGSMLALLFFILIELYHYARKNLSIKLLKVIVVIVLVGSYLLPIIMVYLFRQGNELSIVLFDKPVFTGREVLWNQFFNRADDHIIIKLFGMGSNKEWWKGYNLHSDTLYLLQQFGYAGFLAVWNVLYQILRISSRKMDSQSDRKRLYLVALSIYVLGFVELSFFKSKYIYYSGMMLGLVMNNNLNFNRRPQFKLSAKE